MPRNLVIVESPAKAKTINKYLGKDFMVEASIGHVKDLPKSKLGVDIERGYKPHYIIIRGKGDILKKLRSLAGKVEKIYIATDPDREGEAIAWHIKSEIEKSNRNVFRVLFTEITQSGIKSGMENPRDIDRNLVDAQQARRVLDRLVGYKVSPFLWKTVQGGLSAGRVQSVALRLICEREEEIKNFKPQEYWTIEAEFITGSGEIFTAKLYRIDGKEPKIPDKETAERILDDLKSKKFEIADIQRKEVRRNPSPPFITSTLQQEAINRLKFSAKKTMTLAQQLYEGIELGDEGRVGLITYMRTDSTRISDEAISAVRDYIYNNFGKDYLPDKPRVFKKSKVSQDAHEAIRPTYMKYEPRKVKKYLSKDLYLLYELIWNRFVACQMSSAILEQTIVDVKADRYLFRATGSIVKFRGYLQVYEDVRSASESKEEGEEVKIPTRIDVGEKVKLTNLIPKQHFTKPPPRFTEASLVKELESLGIGRPSTYATIISTLFERGYVELDNRRLIPTDLGIAVNRILISNFPQLFNVKFTAEMEEDLDKIASGEKTYVEVMDEFYKPFKELLDNVESRSDIIRESVQEKTDIVCDLCGSNMVIKFGKYGKYLACSNSGCKNTMVLPEDGRVEEQKVCPRCGGKLILRMSRYGKFYGCVNYPRCDYTEPITMGIKCPECRSGELVERKTRRGKVFYSCSRYPDCKFAIWDKPVNRPCPECGFQILTERRTKEGKIYKCPGEECGAEIPAEAAELSEQTEMSRN
jgi:DNA topoisomerase-1